MTKAAICMATAGRKSVTAVSLYAISALAHLEDVTVYIRDADNDALWTDEACAGALNAIALRADLQYRRGTMNGIGADRWELMEEAIKYHDHVLVLDSDAVVPEDFLTISQLNIKHAGKNWGFIGHFGIDVLQPNGDGFKEALIGDYMVDTHYNWQKTGALHNGLYPSNSVAGFCVWYRSAALKAIEGNARRVMRYLSAGEDSALCLQLSSRFDCYVAAQPWIRHYRSVDNRTSRTALVGATQRTSFSELRRMDAIDETRENWFKGLIKNFHDD
jgi:hypothetical protein